jgi:hypothetical protein
MKRSKPTRSQQLALDRARVDLLTGRRLEIHGKGGLVLYAGSSDVHRPDPFWYEHPGGRTYKQTPEEVIRAILPHVGYEAIEKAVRHARDPGRRKKGKRMRDPRKEFTGREAKFEVGKTYDVVTPESAEEGDVEESGWVFEPVMMSLRDTVREIENLGAFEPDSWPMRMTGTRISLYQVDGDVDYGTGAETREALHIRGSASAMKRLLPIIKDMQ